MQVIDIRVGIGIGIRQIFFSFCRVLCLHLDSIEPRHSWQREDDKNGHCYEWINQDFNQASNLMISTIERYQYIGYLCISLSVLIVLVVVYVLTYLKWFTIPIVSVALAHGMDIDINAMMDMMVYHL